MLLLLPLIVAAQTTIGMQSMSNTSVILEFPTGTTKGIILPAVQNLPVNPSNGTFAYNRETSKVMLYANNSWVELSGKGNGSQLVPYGGAVSIGEQTIIGSLTTKVYNGTNFVDGLVNGVVVLEGSTKALVLPKVSNTSVTVKSPYPGMMCYDITKKALAVFDGAKWYYWK